jgi:predicted nucleic acid-binding protein
MNTFALDTNIISYLLRHNPVVSARLRRENDSGNMIAIPPLVYYEIKRGLLADKSKKRLRSFENFYEDIGIGEMTLEAYDEASRQYASLRQIGRPTGDADILIAAFCLVNGYTLVTNNTKHFEHIKGLQLVDWTQEQFSERAAPFVGRFFFATAGRR